MPSWPGRADVVICGAGMAGIATAYYLTQHGVCDVVLVERNAPLALTSDKSAECYRDWWPDPLMAAFVGHSIDLMEQLATATNNGFAMNRRGYGYVALSEAAMARFHAQAQGVGDQLSAAMRIHDPLARTPYHVAPEPGWLPGLAGADLLLDSAMIRRHYPYLTTEARAILHARRCGWLSAQQLGMSLLEQARARGVRVVYGEVSAVAQDARGVSALRLVSEGREGWVASRCFVNAAGPFARQIGALVGVDLPVETVLHEKIVIRDDLRVLPRSAPMLVLADDQRLDWTDEERQHLEQAGSDEARLLAPFPAGVYLRPEGGEDSPCVLLGWAYDEQPSAPCWQPPLSPLFPEVVLRGAARLLPALRQYVGRVRPVHDGGYYTKTHENLPLIGPIGPPGSFVVGALSGYGIMAACAAGELASEWITGHTLPPYAVPFSLRRYEDPAYQALLAGSRRGEL